MKPAVLLMLLAPLASQAQVTQSSVTATVTQNLNVQPDQASLTVTVNSPITSTRDDVAAAVQPLGLTAASLTSVYTSQTYFNASAAVVQSLNWNFQLTVPISNLKSETA